MTGPCSDSQILWLSFQHWSPMSQDHSFPWRPHYQNFFVGYQNPWRPWMAGPMQPVPKRLIRAKGSIRAIYWLGWIPWAPVALDLPSEVTLDSKIQGNSAGSACPRDISWMRTLNCALRPSWSLISTIWISSTTETVTPSCPRMIWTSQKITLKLKRKTYVQKLNWVPYIPNLILDEFTWSHESKSMIMIPTYVCPPPECEPPYIHFDHIVTGSWQLCS